VKPGWLALIVGFLALVVHARAIWGGFVFHDDYRYVVNNTAIDEVGNPLRFFTDLSTLSPQSPTRDIYRPVRTLSYAVVTAVSGKESAAPFHKLAVALHAGTTALLALLLLRAGLGAFAAAGGALLFGLSPVTVEVTAWVCSLGDGWCGLLSVASVLAYAADRRPLALLALVAALFSKEHAVVVPGLWIAWDACIRPERVSGGAWRKTLLLGAAPAAALVLAFLLFRAEVAGARTSQVEEPIGGSIASAVWTMTAGLGWYAATILLPYGPTFDAVVTVRRTPFDPGVLLGLLVLGALAYAVVRGPPRVRLGALWFLLSLVPVHNVFVPLKIPTADRFLYLPLMGLPFLLGELAERTRPFASRWMTAALALLAVLTVARIGDWKDNESLLAAGMRVAPKSHRLIWEEAAIAAERAQYYLLKGDLESARRIASYAASRYELYLRNSYPAEQTQVYVELGDLLFAVGRAGDPQREIARNALGAYGAAFALQEEGIGRITEEERRHVAERIVQLAADLVVGNDAPGPTIQAGLKAAHFLKERYGFDDTGLRVVFRLADSIRVRGQQPAEARKGFDWVLETVGKLEAKGAKYPYIRAQARFYRAVLRDQDFNRAELERAYQEYVDAAADPVQMLQALVYAGRCACTIGSLFKDATWTAKGKEILAEIPAVAAQEGLVLDDRLRNEILTIDSGCGR
jgi:protein O-mannosyl-transferase